MRRLAVAALLALDAALFAAAGCAGSAPPAAAPSLMETVADCWSCLSCAKDITMRAAGKKAGPPPMAPPAAVP